MKSKNVSLYDKNGTWYARFRVKIHHPERGIDVKQCNISTLKPALAQYRAEAQKIANERRDAELKAFWAGANGKKALKLRDSTPTCGQIADIFVEKSASPYAGNVADVFLTVVAEGVGRWTDPADREKAREIKLSALTKTAMVAFRDQVARKAAGLPMIRNEVSINTYMRQAKNVFSRKAREHYERLNVPATIHEWASALPLDEDHHEQKFISIPRETLEAADAAAPQCLAAAKTFEEEGRMNLANQWRNAYACYLLMRYCGLRNVEVENLRWEWFTPREDGEYMVHIMKRGYWKPKKSSGSVPVDRALYLRLLELFGPAQPGADGFVLAGTMTDRKEGTHRVVQGFIKRYIQQGSKNAYCLRKQFATELENQYDLKTAAAALRHGNDTETARNHYVDGNVRLERMAPLKVKLYPAKL